jgi:hypothetical protein
MTRMLLVITAVSLTLVSGLAYGMAGVGAGVSGSAGTKRPQKKARVPGRPKGGAFLAVGYPGVMHAPLHSRCCLRTELTRVSTSTITIDRAAASQP